MKGIDSAKTATQRLKEERLLTKTFLETPCGRLANSKLLHEGKVYVPLFSSAKEATDKTKEMLACVTRLVEGGGGAVDRKRLMRYRRIQGEDRFMVPPKKLGDNFVRPSAVMEDAMMYVLRALDSPGYDQIQVEESSCLISLCNCNVQVSSLSRFTRCE